MSDEDALLRRIAESAKDLTRARYAAIRLAGADPRLDGNGDNQRPAISVAIRVRGEVFGTLDLADKIDGGAFTERDNDVVGALADAAGAAIEGARLLEESRRREHWLEATTEITASLLSGRSALETLELVADLAREVAGAEQAVLALRAEGGDELIIDVVSGLPVAGLIGQAVPVKTTAVGQVLTTGEARLIPDTAGTPATPSPAAAPLTLTPHGPRALIPLTAGTHVLGVLSVTRPVRGIAFDTTDVAMLTAFAVHAALTLEYGRAQQDRARLAVFEDRDRIAHDLHDLVVQRLFAVGLGLQGAARLIDRPETAERVAGFVGDLDDTIAEVRRTIFALHRPASTPSISLRSEVLLEVSEARGAFTAEPHVMFDGPIDAMTPADVRIDLLATLREALTNIAQHARASSAEIVVVADPQAGFLQLQVTDDGIGMSQDTKRAGSLAGLGERARQHGGWLTVQPHDGKGTQLVWQVPAHP